jgi:hypothetical protein
MHAQTSLVHALPHIYDMMQLRRVYKLLPARSSQRLAAMAQEVPLWGHVQEDAVNIN